MRDYLGFFTFIVLTLLTLFLVWYGLRLYGPSRPISDYETQLSKELKESSAIEPILWTSDFNSSFVWLDTTFENEEWIVSKTHPERLAIALQSKIQAKSKILLFFSGRDSRALPSLRNYFKERERWKRVVFCSRFDGLLRDLRELEPKWTFCSGENYLTRILAFSSLGIESMLEISADVVFIHTLPTVLHSKQLPAIIAESHRQNKLVFIGPVDQSRLPRPSEGLKPNGWMVHSQDQKVQ